MNLAINPLIALGVLASTAATDAAYVFFNAAVSSRRRVWASAPATPDCSSSDQSDVLLRPDPSALSAPISGCAANASSQSCGPNVHQIASALAVIASALENGLASAIRPAHRDDPQQRRNARAAASPSSAFKSASLMLFYRADGKDRRTNFSCGLCMLGGFFFIVGDRTGGGARCRRQGRC